MAWFHQTHAGSNILSMSRKREKKFNYGLVILGLIFGNLFVEGGVRNSQPVLLPALKQNFASSATMTSAVFSVSGIVAGFASPIIGRILDRIGPRYMFPIAGTVILVGWWASSLASDTWQIFIFYSFIATLGHTAIGSFTGTAVLAPWFPQSKGVMLGLADSGNPAGQAVITPLAQYTITNFGLRTGFQVVGFVFFLMTVPLNFLLQRNPPVVPVIDKAGIPQSNIRVDQPYKEDPPNKSISIPENLEGFNAMHEPTVWLLLLSRSAASVAHQMTHLHILAFFVLAGYGEMQAAGALGLAGIIGIVARPCFGILSDKMGREIVFTIAMSMTFFAIVTVILFTGGANLWALIFFVVLSGLSDGLSGLILGAKAADIYRPDVLGRVMGIVDVGRGIGWATGGLFTGVMFDLFGDYSLAYWIASSMALLSIAAVWGVKLLEDKS